MKPNPPTPGDELVERARAICAEARPEHAEGFLSGKFDASSTEMRAVLIALRTRDEAARSATSEEEVADGVHEELWKADAENKRLREILETAEMHISHSLTCSLGALHNCTCGVSEVRDELREALQAKDHSDAG